MFEGLILDLYGLMRRAEGDAIAGAAADPTHGPDGRAGELLRLERLLERMHLFQLAMLELLIERTGVTERQILAKVEEIDRRDGKTDGKLAPRPEPCPSCTRLNHSQRSNCVYCGAGLPFRHGRVP
jgi:hypothetical protein